MTASPPPDELASVAAELYGLPPQDFVAARTEAEKRAKAAGNRVLAAGIRKLGKPTAVAWLANQLVRQHADEIEPLLQLGADLREATAALSGEQLRQLSRQQHQVIDALVRQARAIGKAAGHPLSEATARGLDETLRAALADPDLAEQLRAGLLTQALEHVGFGAGAADFHAPPRRAEPATRAPAEPAADLSRKRAEKELREARAESERAERNHRRAENALAGAEDALSKAGGQVERLQAELERAETERAKAEAVAQSARGHVDETSEEATTARSRLEKAESALE